MESSVIIFRFFSERVAAATIFFFSRWLGEGGEKGKNVSLAQKFPILSFSSLFGWRQEVGKMMLW